MGVMERQGQQRDQKRWNHISWRAFDYVDAIEISQHFSFLTWGKWKGIHQILEHAPHLQAVAERSLLTH